MVARFLHTEEVTGSNPVSPTTFTGPGSSNTLVKQEAHMSYDFQLSESFDASPQAVYDAWMGSGGHTAMTGGHATVDATVGGKYTAWDEYIWGTTLELDPGKRIVQTWRTSEFTGDDEDSQIELLLEPVDGGTRLTLLHTRVPEHDRSYEDGGWEDNYFRPMRAYFASN